MVSFEEIGTLKELRQVDAYYILNMETTGADPKQDRISRVGMLQVSGGEVVRKAGVTVREDPVDGESTEAQLAENFGRLLPDAVVLAEKKDLAFLKALLENNGQSGQIRTVDLGGMVAALIPSLAGQELASVTAYFDIAPRAGEEAILRPAFSRWQIFEACKKLAEPVKKEPRRSLEERVNSGMKAKLPWLSKRVEEKRAELEERPRKKQKHAVPEKLTEAEVLWYVASGVCLLAAVLSLLSFSSLLFLLAAVALCPHPWLRERLKLVKITGWIPAAIGGVLFILAVLLLPHKAETAPAAEPTPPSSYIVLSWDDPGRYGKKVTLDTDEGKRTRVEFRIPRGVYKVLNNNPVPIQVNVYTDGEPETTVDPETEEVYDNGITSLIRSNGAREVTVDTDQYFLLSDDAQDVIFLYVGEVPEIPPEELNKPKAQEVVYAYVNGTDVRFRSAASLNSNILDTFDTGQQVQVVSQDGEWTCVMVNHQRGYIYSKYLSDTMP